MNAYQLRTPRPEDTASITQLWQSAFHDSPDLIAKLLEDSTLLENAVAAEQNGQICSIMFSFPGLVLGSRTAAYLYALCTRPDVRGLGMASSVLRTLIKKCFSDGADLVFLSPAEESLSHWYQKVFGMTPLLPFSDISISPIATEPARCTMINYEEYAALRCAPAIATPELLRVQELFLRENGGGFLQLALPGGPGLACVESSFDGLLVAELLCSPEEEATALWSLKAHFSADRILRRIPDKAGSPLLALSRDGSSLCMQSDICFPFIMD